MKFGRVDIFPVFLHSDKTLSWDWRGMVSMLNLFDVNIKCIRSTVLSERCEVLSDIINVITSSTSLTSFKSEVCNENWNFDNSLETWKN